MRFGLCWMVAWHWGLAWHSSLASPFYLAFLPGITPPPVNLHKKKPPPSGDSSAAAVTAFQFERGGEVFDAFDDSCRFYFFFFSALRVGEVVFKLLQVKV